MKKTLAIWIEAIRLRTLPLALASIGLGSFLAAFDGRFRLNVLIWSGLTTIFLQILSNLANDYGDSKHGADHKDRKGPSRAVQSGAISPPAMLTAIIITTILSVASGLVLLFTSLENLNWVFLLFLFIGLLTVGAAINYTMGKNPYGYTGLGDLSVVLFFGLAGVLGSYYLHTGLFKSIHILPALSCGLLSAAVLNVNNIRDIKSDAIAGKRSIPVRLGRKIAVVYHWALLGSATLLAFIFVIYHYHTPLQFLFVLSLPMLIVNGVNVGRKEQSELLDPYLKQMAISTLLFVLTFGIGILL